jgi:hypothetical protein
MTYAINPSINNALPDSEECKHALEGKTTGGGEIYFD